MRSSRAVSPLRASLWILLVSCCLSSCLLGRYVVYNFAGINDYKKFPSRALVADAPQAVFHSTANGKFPKEVDDRPFEQFLEEQKTVAFLLIRHDTIQYEKYFKGYDEESIVASFSMAKSVTSLLIGCAIDDGFIASVDEPVTTYIPELQEAGFDRVTIKHLLQMTSGLDFNESYVNPFGEAATFYYGRNLRKQMAKMKLKTAPGKDFDYVSGNTQLLGLVLERALKGKNITAYLQEKIWTPLGMEYDASWSIDRKTNGIEKTFCCLNARARDFAKLGRLYKNKGMWNGQQIISQQWVEASTQPEVKEGSVRYYQYQWWIPRAGEDFMAQGILGQYVYVHPAKDLIIVRLGKKQGKTDWWSLFTALADAY